MMTYYNSMKSANRIQQAADMLGGKLTTVNNLN